MNAAKVSRSGLWAMIIFVSVIATIIVVSLTAALRQNAATIEAALVEERANLAAANARIEELTLELESTRDAGREAETRIAEWQNRATDVARQVNECERRIDTAEEQFRRYASEVQKSLRSAISGVPFCNVIAPLVEQIADPDRYIRSFTR